MSTFERLVFTIEGAGDSELALSTDFVEKVPLTVSCGHGFVASSWPADFRP